MPYAGVSWQLETKARPLAHAYIRNGTATWMTRFCPVTGEVRVQGTRSCTNAVLHPWMPEALWPILAALPEPEEPRSAEENRRQWERWQEGCTIRMTLPSALPRLRLLLVMDNLTGHRTPSVVLWLFAHGIMPLYTPLGGSWLNMGESIQRLLTRRGLDGQHPQTPDEIITWREAAARGWNTAPTPFQWGSKRALRRQRSRERRHKVGGSYAFTHRPLRRARTVLQQWQQACQTTH
jgi:hypothetical protein